MTVSVLALSVDCADAAKLAGFWAAALGRQVEPGASAESARVGTGDVASTGPLLLFHQVPDTSTGPSGLTIWGVLLVFLLGHLGRYDRWCCSDLLVSV